MGWKKDALPFILLAVFIFVVPRILLHPWHPFLAVASSSMRPTLNVGDLILVKGCSITEVNVGDVIVFTAPNGDMIVHRAIEVHRSPDGFFVKTKGDANPCPDPWKVDERAFVGKVVFSVPLVGYLSLNSHAALCVIAGLLLIIMVMGIKSRIL